MRLVIVYSTEPMRRDEGCQFSQPDPLCITAAAARCLRKIQLVYNRAGAMTSDSASVAAAAAATATAGLAAGALTFVSLVDTRALLEHVRAGRVELIRVHFAAWWPAGRDMMVPLISACALTHVAAFAATRDPAWLAGGACLFAIVPYTKTVLAKDIATLIEGKPENTGRATTRFCRLHHVRTGLAAAGFGIAIATSRRV